MSKQNFHKPLDRCLKAESDQAYLLKIVEQIREDHPTMNSRSMYYKIKPEGIGRDKFEALCRQWRLTKTSPINYKKTTNSYGVTRFDNLTVGLKLTGVNQLFVSDITYFEVKAKYYYITFITDGFSRYIVGHYVSDRLITEQTTLPALKMAIYYRKNNIPKGCIFHSDGGGQYYDKVFLKLTKKYGFKNSMCEYAWENGKAERVNGIIKNNYLIHKSINSLEALIKAVDRSIMLYNTEKPHQGLNFRTPLEIENKCINLDKTTTPMMTESFDAKFI